jgi:hypothetical protein
MQAMGMLGNGTPMRSEGVTAVVTDVRDKLRLPIGHPAGRMTWTSRGTSVAAITHTWFGSTRW